MLNEAGAIGPTIAALPRAVGGSTDGTADEARSFGAEVIVERGAGYGRSRALGVARARDAGAEVALFLEGADPAEEAERLVGSAPSGAADLVLASRTRGPREAGSMAAHQVLAGLLIGRVVGLVCGVRYSDMSAFRGIRLDRLAALGMREMTYGWNLEMQMRAAHAGLRILEVPLPYRQRLAGGSKVAGSLGGTFRAGRHIVGTLLRVGVALHRAGPA